MLIDPSLAFLWPPSVLTWPPDESWVERIKLLLALAAVVVLTTDLYIARSPWIAAGLHADRTRRVRSAALVCLACMSAWAWTNFGRFQSPPWPVVAPAQPPAELAPARLAHPWDFFHYYMGAKYFRELGYNELYPACLVAEHQLNPHMAEQIARRKIRRMSDYAIVKGDWALGRAAEIQDRFSPPRWAEFVADWQFFRGRIISAMGRNKFEEVLHDHGYNPSPAWNAVGSAFANVVPVSGPDDAGNMERLAMLDLVLLSLAVLVLVWGFGVRAAAVVVIAFGTSQLAEWKWIGGSLLRYDWLFMLALGLACLNRRWWAAAGVALTYAAGVRAFPAAVFLGPAVLAGRLFIRRRLDDQRLPGLRRLAISAAATASGLAVVAMLAAGSTAVWGDWLAKIDVHRQTALTNYIGMKFALAFDADRRAERTVRDDQLDPFAEWKRLQQETLARRAWLVWGVTAIAALAFLGVAKARPVAAGATLGLLMIIIAFDLTGYYYGWLALVPLAATAKRWAWLAVGVLCVNIAHHITALRFGWYDVRFATNSAIVLAFVLLSLAVSMWNTGCIRRRLRSAWS